MNKTVSKKLIGCFLGVTAMIFAAGVSACGSESECTHEWNEGAVTAAATCTTEGITTYTCNLCGETKTETIAKTAHTYADTWTAVADGHYHVCSVCGGSDTVAAHTFGDTEVLQAATETQTGVMGTVCTVCGYESTRVIPVIEQEEPAEPTEPTESADTVSADFANDFSTAESTGTWSYGSVSYSWSADNKLTYSSGDESFTFNAAASLNADGDGWIAGSAEIKAGWISADEMTGIAYTAGKDMVAAVSLTYTGTMETTALSLRVAVVSSDGTSISFISNAKEYTYSAILNLKSGDTIYFIFNNEGSGYPQADLSIGIDELSLTSDFTADFTTENQDGAWGYGSVSYSWDAGNPLTYSDGSESFNFTAAASLNADGDGWISESAEIKADWISAGSMTGISYTADNDMTAAIVLTYAGATEATALSLRVAVVSADGTAISFISNAHSYTYSETFELKTGDTVYFIFNNEGSGYPQADISITVY